MHGVVGGWAPPGGGGGSLRTVNNGRCMPLILANNAPPSHLTPTPSPPLNIAHDRGLRGHLSALGTLEDADASSGWTSTSGVVLPGSLLRFSASAARLPGCPRGLEVSPGGALLPPIPTPAARRDPERPPWGRRGEGTGSGGVLLSEPPSLGSSSEDFPGTARHCGFSASSHTH